MKRERFTIREYADRIGVKYGTVKRWVHEGMPVIRGSANLVRIIPSVADRWVDAHHATSCAFHRLTVVYFAEAADGAIKVGFTSNVKQRLWDLAKDTGAPVKLLGCIRGDKHMESMFHRALSPMRIEGEWYRLDDAALTALRRKFDVAA